MTVEQLVAVLGAVTLLLGAITALFVQIRRLEFRVDGRLTQLLELTKVAAIAEGKLAEKEGGTLVPIDEPVHNE
jgi:hypothetical protein